MLLISNLGGDNNFIRIKRLINGNLDYGENDFPRKKQCQVFIF